jgi:hypothetical protein
LYHFLYKNKEFDKVDNCFSIFYGHVSLTLMNKICKTISDKVESLLVLISICYTPSSKAMIFLEEEHLNNNPRLQDKELEEFVETEIALCKKRASREVGRPSVDVLIAKLSPDNGNKRVGCPDCKNGNDCTTCVQHREKQMA